MKLKTRLTRLAAVVAAEAEANDTFRKKLEDLLMPATNAVKSSKSSASSARGRSSNAKGTREGLAEAPTARRGNRRPPAALDPVSLARDDRKKLQSELSKLDHEKLLDVVAEYGMDPGKLVMKWKDDDRIIERIVEVSIARATKGDAFRSD